MSHNFAWALSEQADRQPDRRAVRFLGDGAGEWSFADWLVVASAYAERLTESCRPGDRALILLPPGLDFVGAFLGCLHAGVVAVPAYPPLQERSARRLAAMAEDSDPSVVLTHDSLRGMVEPGLGAVGERAQWLDCEGVAASALGGVHVTAPVDRGEDDLAFLQYTSGSTGQPKGTMVGHGNLVANSTAIAELFGHSRDSQGVIWLPPYHDMGLVGGILQPAWVGFPVDLMSPLDFLVDPSSWVRAVSEAGATTSGGPNFAFDLCLRKTPPEVRETLDLSRWSVAFCGGEPVRAETMAAFADGFAGAGFSAGALYPCYGLAETTLIAAGVRRGEGARTGTGEGRVVSSGSAAPGHRLSVLCPTTGRNLVEGEGEICVEGPSVARGYWRDVEGTAATFGTGDTGRRVRTGDLGRLVDDELFVTGRLKNTIIVRGRNHVAEDVEAVLAGCHPAVRPGGVAAFEVSTATGPGLGLALEVNGDPMSVAGEQILTVVQRMLAETLFLRAEQVHLLARGALPKTPSGKLQRAEARELVSSAATPAVRLLAPGATVTGPSQLAIRIAEVAACVLEVDDLPADRPLTACGLDSLRAVQLRQAVRDQLQRQVPLVDLLTGATCEDLAAAASHREPATEEALAKGELPSAVSDGETGLWLASRLARDPRTYVLQVRLELGEDTDTDVLARAIGWLSLRHPSLRTTFPDAEGRPGRRVLAASLRLDVVNVADDRAAESSWGELVAEGLDLVHGPVCRARLVCAPGRLTLALTIHHAVSDVWSLDVLADELGAAYTAFVSGEEPELPATTDPEDLAAREARMLAGPAGRDLVARWQERLADCPPPARLPGTTSGRAAGTTSVRTEIDLSAEADAVRRLAGQGGCTVFAVLETSIAWALRAVTGLDRFVVGMLTPGRDEAGVRTIAYRSNPVPLVCEVSGTTPFATAVTGSARHTAEAFALQGLPVSRLVQECVAGVERPRELISVLLVQQQAPSGAALGLARRGATKRLGALTVSDADVDRGTTPFDVTLEVVDDGTRLDAALMHAASTLPTTEGETFAAVWLHVLRQVLEDPDRSWDDLSLVPPDQAEDQVSGWNTADPRAFEPVPRTVLRHARTHPNAPAVHDVNRTLDYAALARAARSIAHGVLQAGGGHDHPVAMYLPRSVDAVAALLGIQLAGSPYLPLDPDHPEPRLRAILDDAVPEVVVTDEATRSQHPDLLAEMARVLLIEDLLTHDVPDDDAGLSGLDARSEHLSHVMYTSGSTGQPKGVACCHGGVHNLVMAYAERAGLRPGDACGWWTSTGFDVSVQEIFSALATGACVEVFPPSAKLDPNAFASWVEDHGLTCAYVPPHLLPGLVARLERSEQPTTLRSVLVGVEPIPEPMLRRLMAVAPGTDVVNGYGPTESTVWATWYDVPRDGTNQGITPLGRSVPNGPAYVLDEHLHLTPVGARGELFVAGAGTARGYLGRPSATAERFLPVHGETASGCTARATRSATPGTDSWCSWDAGTARPRCAACVSRWVRWRPPSAPTRAWSTPSSCRVGRHRTQCCLPSPGRQIQTPI